jgi:hypothetical protein
MLVLAILYLVDKQACIFSFIDSAVSDGDLPLNVDASQRAVYKKSVPGVPLPCFNGWSFNNLDLFENWQWRVKLPFFRWRDGDEGGQVLEFDRRQKLPILTSPSQGPYMVGNSGGYGQVSCIKMHPSCYDYDAIFRKAKVRSESPTR